MSLMMKVGGAEAEGGDSPRPPSPPRIRRSSTSTMNLHLHLFRLGFLLLISLSFSSSPPSGSGRGRGGVAAQLYTVLDDVAAVYGLLMEPFNNEKFLTIGRSVNPISKQKVNRTCMAPFQITLNDQNPNVNDDWGAHRRNTQHNFFCAGIPAFRNENDPKDVANRNGPGGYPGDRLLAPHSLFWRDEPSALSWFKRKAFSPADQMRYGMEAKDMGWIWKIDVTGIKQSGGRFLKGWYHLKITLGTDHNKKNQHPSDYYIDKLVVSARGRSLVPGKPRAYKDDPKKNVLRPPRRTWIGGIGEFVRDFPTCMGVPNIKSVRQNYITCGTVQYAESQHGGNYYYSHTNDQGRYGQRIPEGQGPGKQEVHLNYRLDNSFCNKYYDLEFVAIGIISSQRRNSDGNWRVKTDTEPIHDFDYYWGVLRSVSTRFTFASSYAHHHPDYYENADPIPRNVKELDCSQPLQGEWRMNNYTDTGTEGETNKRPGSPTPKKHWVSVTKGADLLLTNAPPDATFYGAIKFITPVPHDLNTQFDDGGIPKDDARYDFSSRRSYTYLQRMYRSDGQAYSNPMRYWKDRNALPQTPSPDWFFGSEVANTIAGVQRVMNEMDWETWVERYLDVSDERRTEALNKCSFFIPAGVSNGDEYWKTADPADLKKANDDKLAWSDAAAFWPHPYYDNTCGGIDVYGQEQDSVERRVFQKLKWDIHSIALDWSDANSNAQQDYKGLTEYQYKWPQISGRCEPSIWYNSGFGDWTNPAPYCDEFFRASKLWRQDKRDRKKFEAEGKSYTINPNATADPALAKVVETVERQGRKSWEEKYLHDNNEALNQLTCDIAIALKQEFKECATMPPRPWTPKAPYHVPPTREEQEQLDWESRKKYEFKRTKAYRRGMLISESPYTLYIWDTRLIHGFFMTIITMFLTPVSIFVTRYFKETFMDTRIMLHHVWYFVHLFFSLATQLLFMVGLWRISKVHELLGYSLGGNSMTHRTMGWMALVISIFLFFFGGIRTMHRKCRAAIMLVHWFGGIFFYLLCLACMVSAIGIPASPAAYKDFTVGELQVNAFKEPLFYIVLGWFAFDIIMHLVMSFLQWRNDKKMKLTERRFYFLSPMPVIAENFRFDTPGRFPRIYLLCIYLVVSLCATSGILILMYKYSPRGRGLGFMSCTHEGPDNEVRTTMKGCGSGLDG